MSKANQKLSEIFIELESMHLNLIKNEDEFIKSWNRYKEKSEKVIITNYESAQFYADCEKFTKLIIKTRLAHEELDKKWDALYSRKGKLQKRGIGK
jgi:hypothetical protein